MRTSTLTIACAVGAMLLFAPPPASAQTEVNLSVAAGQPLRAMRPLEMVSSFFVPEVTKRAEAAGIKINWKEAYAGSLLKPTSRRSMRSAFWPTSRLPSDASIAQRRKKSIRVKWLRSKRSRTRSIRKGLSAPFHRKR